MKQVTEAMVAKVVTPRAADSYKGQFGRVLIIGGSAQYGGAVIMAASAAVYSGAGLVTVATNPVNRGALHARVPEAMVVPDNPAALPGPIAAASVVVLGPGLGTSDHAWAIVRTVLDSVTNAQVLILDGSALALIADNRPVIHQRNVIWTPHQAEWARLAGLSISAQTAAANQLAATKLPGTVIVKSHRTQIFSPTASYQNPIGTPAQATGGSGDTLTGVLAAFVGQFDYSDQTVAAAVYTHSAVAEEIAATHYVAVPSLVIARLPQYLQKMALR